MSRDWVVGSGRERDSGGDTASGGPVRWPDEINENRKRILYEKERVQKRWSDTMLNFISEKEKKRKEMEEFSG